jgi:CubicO group peptidase (beta-lactamase class C family)
MRVAVSLLAGLSSIAAAAPTPLSNIQNIVGDRSGQPGCAMAIVEDGRIAFEKGYGLANLDTKAPITPRTSFNIASMTKQFTGMAVALLVAESKLRESDDIRKYLPELKDYGRPITIANLLNHSTGLRNHMALAAFQPGDHLPSHEEALRLVFRQSALNFAPGTRHQYESPNYVLLAEIVARVSGKPYPEFLAERILTPLGMADSGYATASLAPSYAGSADKSWTKQDKVNRAMGSSGLQSSVHDFAQWMINYDRQAVGGAAAQAKMLSTSKLADGSAIPYRYGLIKEFDYAGVKGLTRISHGGQTAAYRSAFSWFPGRSFGDVVMCNYMADAHAVDLAIVSQFVGRLKEPQPPSVGGSFSAPAMRADLPARFAGTWYSAADDDIREFAVKDGGLALRYFGEDYPLQWTGGTTFVLPDQGQFRFTGNMLEEVFDGQARLHFAKLPPVAPQPLAEFAGTYRSSDVDGPVTVAIKGNALTIAYAAGEATLRHIGRDRFASPEEDFNSVRFQRAKNGRVTGLTLTVSSGITRLRFARAPR